MTTAIKNQQMKQVFKEAIAEILEERREAFRDLIMESLEDTALIHAIQQGEKTKTVPREKIFQLLER